MNKFVTFRVKIMKDHHDLYLKADVLLLAYVFEFFYRRIYKFF